MIIGWEAAFGIGALILGLALAYGLVRYYTRNKAKDRITEKATHEIYHDPSVRAPGPPA